MFWVNDTSYMDEESFLHWGRTIWKYRSDTKGENQPQSVLLLDDLRSHKTKKILEEFRVLYNTRIIVLPGGLTPKAQIMDTHNNRPFKASYRRKISKIRLDKYKAAKAEREAHPNRKKGRVGIPRIDRGEALECMLEAWAELPQELGANAWAAVKLYPYEAAVQIGWTPKEAFADIRHCDYPWQSVSQIRPKDTGSDVEAFEWDNVPEEFYSETQTPAEVRAELAARPSAPDDVPHTDTQAVSSSEQPVPTSTETPPTVTATPGTPAQPSALPPATVSSKKAIPPAQRKVNPIFTFKQPPLLPCTQANCDEENILTKSRCHSCSKPGHGNCLHDRVLCTECYNARMVSHKAEQAKKRAAAKANKETTVVKKARVTVVEETVTKKVRISSGMSKKASSVQVVKVHHSAKSNKSTQQQKQPSTPSVFSRDPKQRAEERMLQLALLESAKVSAPVLSPVKSQRELQPGAYLTVYATAFGKDSPGDSFLTPIEVDKLPSSVHSDGFSVIDDEEAALIKETKDAHIRFMMSRRQSALIGHLLGPKNIALIDGLVFQTNIRQCEINMNFRLFDLLGLLSYRFVTDSVLQCYMHYLQARTNTVYFVNPHLYRYMEEFDKRPSSPFDCQDWLQYQYIFWPFNLGNQHWVCVAFRREEGSTIYYMDSMNDTNPAVAKEEMPRNIYDIVSVLGKSASPAITWNKEVEVLIVPRQIRGNNDCGCCVNELARCFAADPEYFLEGNIDVNFDSISLRCGQAATLLKWLYHDVCE